MVPPHHVSDPYWRRSPIIGSEVIQHERWSETLSRADRQVCLPKHSYPWRNKSRPLQPTGTPSSGTREDAELRIWNVVIEVEEGRKGRTLTRGVFEWVLACPREDLTYADRGLVLVQCSCRSLTMYVCCSPFGSKITDSHRATRDTVDDHQWSRSSYRLQRRTQRRR